VIDGSITLNMAEFERIKTELIQLDADLARLLAQPAVYATVVRADRNDSGVNVVIVFDGKLLEVHGLPGVSFKPSDNVKVDLVTKRILA
jgi:hypothetical protein